MPVKKTVDGYIEGLSSRQKEIVSTLRRIVLEAAPQAAESIKWAQPVYEVNSPFCYIKAHKNNVNLGFWRGAELPDPLGLLEGTGDKMRHIKVTNLSDIKSDAFKDLVKTAVKLNKEKGNPHQVHHETKEVLYMKKKDLRFDIGIPQRFLTEEMDISVLPSFFAKVESLGYHGCWVREQAANDRYDLAPIPLLSYAAALTSKVKLGTSVLLSVLRNPVNLAKSLATLDRLSNGRLIVGVGMGNESSIKNLGAFGITPQTRASRFEEGIVLMKKLWTGEPVTHEGRFYQTKDLFISPRPAQKPHPPIWFGSHAETALRRAARLGDGWMEASARSTQTLQEEIQMLRKFLEEEGRDPTTFTFSKRVVIAVDKDRETALRRLQEWSVAHGKTTEHAKEVAVFGTPDDCIEGLAAVASTGVDMISLDTVYDYEEQAERLAREVIPRV